jgi:iron complex outermembrane receptor protein
VGTYTHYRSHRARLLGAALILPLASLHAAAQTVPQGVENVVVTAQKRSQKAQDVPITITVLDSKALRRLDVRSSDELAEYVPSVQIAMPSGRGNQPLINIRGIGLNDTNTNNAGPNGVYVDEVYQASPAGQTFQTFDLSRVEVLKGPQGTLYGRNTTGGAINYVTNKPTDEFAASEDIQYGSFNTVSTESMVNGQIAPHVDGRLAVQYTYSDGYFKDLTDGNTTNGNNDLAYRGEVAADVSDDLSLLFNFHGGNVNRRPDEYKQVGVLDGALGGMCADDQILGGQCTDVYGYKAPKGFYEGYYNRDQNLYINALGGSVRADWRLGDITLTSLTAWETSHKLHPEDTDAEPYNLIQINYGVKSTDITQELHATGGGETYHWLVGVYALNEHLTQDQPIVLLEDINQVVGPLIGDPVIGNGLAERARTLNGQFTESYAAFGQSDFQLFPGARLTLGGRLTYEHKTFDAFSQASFQENGVFPAPTTLYDINENIANRAGSYRAAFDYKLLPAVLTYVSISTGFKSAGFNGGFLANDVPDALEQLKPIKPEYITAYETGFKSDFLDQRLRFNAAAFYYSYRDEQTYNLIQAPSSGGAVGALPLTVLTNAPTATIKGAEFEIDATPVKHLTTSVSLSFLDARLGRFVSDVGSGPVQNLSGNQLPNAPRFNAIMQADYAYPLPRGDVVDLSSVLSYRSHQFFESNNDPLVAQNGYWLVDARLSYDTADKHWEVAAIGKNLAGQKFLNFSNDLTSGLGLIEEIVGPPRYVGGELLYRY